MSTWKETPMTTENLNDITREEKDAVAAAQKAAEAAEEARRRVDVARERAEQERAVANREYMALLDQEWPEARQQAVTTVADAHQALDQAVRGGGDVFDAYIRWVGASVRLWELDEALARMRRFHGASTRDVPAPAFNFNLDVGVIIDQLSLEAQDEAVQRIDDRRAEYLAGRTPK